MRNNVDISIFYKSKLRIKFKLDTKEFVYISDKGLDKIEDHAKNLAIRSIVDAIPVNDGKKPPFKGHPVFKAQHATATCCRNCLEKWHKIPRGKSLTAEEVNYIVLYIMKWIYFQVNNTYTIEGKHQAVQLSLFDGNFPDL